MGLLTDDESEMPDITMEILKTEIDALVTALRERDTELRLQQQMKS